MARVTHFEFSADDPERTARFYANVFQWDIYKWDAPEEYWLVCTGPDGDPGIDGGIVRSREGMPRTVNTIEVESLDVCCERVERNGGAVLSPKTVISGVGYHAYCRDPEGNVFGVHQPDPEAG